MELNPLNEIMVKRINGLSDKKPKEKIKGKEKLRRTVLDKEKKINFYPQWKQQQGVREEKEERERQHEGRGYIESRREEEMQERREENQVEEEGEEYLSKGEDGRPYIKRRRKQTIGRNKKEAGQSEWEGEEYSSEGEDGGTCIKWRK